MIQVFELPDLGEGIHEGEVVAVRVSVGEQVQEGQPILEIETDKASVEIPSPFNGTVTEIRVKPEDTVKVGSVLMVFGNGEVGGASDLAAPPAEERDPAGAGSKPAAATVGDARASELKPADVAALLTGAAGRARAGVKPAATDEGPPSSGGAKPGAAAGPVPASPATRRLARELGVDLRQVRGSGPAGLVTAEDVRAFADGRTQTAEVPAAPPIEGPESVPTESKATPPVSPVSTPPPLPDFARLGQVERVPLRSVRRATANHMALAWAQIPHVNHQDVVDITELEAFRRKNAAEIEARGGKLTLTVFVMKAVTAALKAFPRFNSSLDVDSQEIVLKRYYHLSIAMDTDRGLIVPVVRDVDRKSISELSIELSLLAQRTRTGDATLEDLQGGTFTITNIGALGGTGFSPIVNYPQVAILGMGRAKLQPVVLGDESDYQIVPRLMMPLVLAFDHRVLDGADAARFVRTIVEALEHPDKLWLNI